MPHQSQGSYSKGKAPALKWPFKALNIQPCAVRPSNGLEITVKAWLSIWSPLHPPQYPPAPRSVPVSGVCGPYWMVFGVSYAVVGDAGCDAECKAFTLPCQS